MGILALTVVLMIYVIVAFGVEDVTLSKGEIYEFNKGWTMIWLDGEETVKNVAIEELPYLGKVSRAAVR